MNTFHSIDELVKTLDREKVLPKKCSSNGKLKQIREKQKFYENERIGEVIGQVAKENSLKIELERLKASYMPSTTTS